ncbi:hypothetical protein B2J86_01585 [Acidovorax sp. SRB_14]|nr:hypothetical protein [Acidovorax sp. SRB_14]
MKSGLNACVSNVDSYEKESKLQQAPLWHSPNHGGGWAFFATAVGQCAVAWGPHGIVALQLPEATAAATRARLLRAAGALPEAAPPPPVAAAIDTIAAFLDGRAPAMDGVLLDMRGVTDFQRRVYALALRIAPGQTSTYGELAAQLGGRHLARAVGQALGHNPFAPVVPCHRVLAAGGRAGGFSAEGGTATKLRLLQIEGARFGAQPGLFDAGPVSAATAPPAAPARAPTAGRSPRPGWRR